MRFQKYALYKLEEKLDELGNVVNVSVKVDEIEACLSVNSISQIDQGLLHQVKIMSAITKYSNFDENEKYYLLKDNRILNIKNIIFGRFTKFDLVEVLR